MQFDYHTRYREGFALWRSPFDRNLYALLMLVLCALPWVTTPFVLGEMAYVFILCMASLGLMTLTGLTGQVSLGHAAFVAIGAYAHGWCLSKGVPLPLSLMLSALVSVFRPYASPGFTWRWSPWPLPSSLSRSLVTGIR
jgi:branched-chain amino acid transport system permease protein